MTERVKVTFAASAISDMVEIRAYYTDQGVPELGERLLGEILNHAESLSVHPDKGRIVPEFDRPNLREVIHPPFRIVYRRDRTRARVVRIWRSERLLKLPL
jgi:plasmid stabilization system protein ParE